MLLSMHIGIVKNDNHFAYQIETSYSFLLRKQPNGY